MNRLFGPHETPASEGPLFSVFHLDPAPYCTRKEAANYLRWKDCDSLDPHLTESEQYEPGKIRFKRLTVGTRVMIRCLRADVLKLLPAPE